MTIFDMHKNEFGSFDFFASLIKFHHLQKGLFCRKHLFQQISVFKITSLPKFQNLNIKYKAMIKEGSVRSKMEYAGFVNFGWIAVFEQERWLTTLCSKVLARSLPLPSDLWLYVNGKRRNRFPFGRFEIVRAKNEPTNSNLQVARARWAFWALRWRARKELVIWDEEFEMTSEKQKKITDLPEVTLTSYGCLYVRLYGKNP